jgi:hypothetical protein
VQGVVSEPCRETRDRPTQNLEAHGDLPQEPPKPAVGRPRTSKKVETSA